MKILLVKCKAELATVLSLKPISFLEPLDLAYVAAGISPQHEVKILDLRLEENSQESKLLDTVNSFTPDILGFSGYTHESPIVKKLAALVKKTESKIITVIGGHHASVMPADYNMPFIDYIVRGEGSMSFKRIVNAINAGEKINASPELIPCGENFDLKAAALLPKFPELDKIPLPRRELYNAADYSCIWPSEDRSGGGTIFPNAAVFRSSYGCVMNCSFCVIPKLSGRKHLVRDPEKAADEIASLKADHIYMCDDETFTNTQYITELHDAIKSRGIHKKYFAWARSTTVNSKPELFKKWKEIGLDTVFLGFESISDKTLKSVSKHSSVAENEKAHHFLRQNKIAVIAGFMLMPDFEESDFDGLEKYMDNMEAAQFNITVCTPSPGSQAWEESKQKFICDPFRLHDCMHPLTAAKLPLKIFYERFANLILLGAKKNPLSLPGSNVPLADVSRILKAGQSYSKAIRNAYLDFEQQ